MEGPSAEEKTEGLRRSDRTVKRTEKVILEELTVLREKYDQMSEESLDEIEGKDLRVMIREVKSICLEYKKKSKELINFYMSKQSTAEANEALSEQQESISNMRERVKIWNTHLVGLGEEACSTIGSLKTSLLSQTPKSRIYIAPAT